VASCSDEYSTICKQYCAASADSTTQLKWIGHNAKNLDKCQGDCDKDSDCVGDLVCWKRGKSDSSAIPGCSGDLLAIDDANNDPGTDYCYDKTSASSAYMGWIHEDHFEDPDMFDPVDNKPAIKSVFKPDEDINDNEWRFDVSIKDILIVVSMAINWITLWMLLAKNCRSKEKKGKYRVVSFDTETDLESVAMEECRELKDFKGGN